jgi:hypothetical protein
VEADRVAEDGTLTYLRLKRSEHTEVLKQLELAFPGISGETKGGDAGRGIGTALLWLPEAALENGR